MKIKHNKKRNTAFVYEALVREGTSAILQKDNRRRDTVVSLIKKHFKPGGTLSKDLECYQSLYKNQNMSKEDCQKIIREARIQKNSISPEALFATQTSLIHDINKEVAANVFNNFVPNYKSLANIYQLFSDSSNPKDRVLLEKLVVDAMAAPENSHETIEVDNIVIESFVKKFNERYDSELLKEQKELLNLYIKSFMDNSVEFKIYLNEELRRLKEGISMAKSSPAFISDEDMLSKADQVLKKLDTFKKTEINDHIILTILRTQSLLQETTADGSNN